jgi:poly(A) polymerase
MRRKYHHAAAALDALHAADFIARGVEKGPALGAALRAVEEAWVKAGFPGEAAALEAIVKDRSER